MKSVLITGGNGYVAKSLYQGIKEKYNVTKISRKEVDLTHASSLKRFLSDKYFDVVIHCAAVGGNRLKQDSWNVCDDNLSMYYNLFQYRDYYGKMIHLGSGAELYSASKPYGFSKSVIRNSVLHTKQFYNIRIFGVFDENELDTRFIKANIKRYINKESLLIHKNKEMDMFYMQDLVTLMDYYVSNEDIPKEVDCTYIETKTLFEIAESINQLSDHRCKMTLESQENDTHYKGKYTDLGLNFVGLDEGIKRTYSSLLKKN